MENGRILPIGIQSFEKIRQGSYLYIDKTRYIQDLVQNGGVYFLSRPRRFGKSLLISALEAYFRGRKELFEGLTISEWENSKGKEAWQEYPVIHFSLADGDFHTDRGVYDKFNDVIENTSARYNLTGRIRGETLPVRFGNLIIQLQKQQQRGVVVLVDEYDKPLLDTAETDPEQEERNRQFYKGFWGVLKSQDAHLRFVFFTGVTKFSKVSIFSDLNQLRDISMLDRMSGICGITEQEIRDNLSPETAAMAAAQDMSRQQCLEELSRMYDGYHFSRRSEGVYNPFSLFNALSDQEFGRYWFETGTPTFLIHRLCRSVFRPEQLVEGVEVAETQLKDYRSENPDPIPLFYQSGYLTITGYDKRFDLYTLRFPNEEVRYGFLNSLVPYVLGEKDAENPYSARMMVTALEKGDTDTLYRQLYSLFASIPYVEGNAAGYESVWRNQIYLVFALLGQFITCEQHTARGRCDCIIKTSDFIYILEFKMQERGTAEEALTQIDDKDYAGQFLSVRQKVIRIGAVFSEEKRNIAAWEVS